MRLATHTDDLLFGISVLVFVGQKRISQQQKAQRTERITSAKAKTDEQAQAQAEEDETDAVEEADTEEESCEKNTLKLIDCCSVELTNLFSLCINRKSSRTIAAKQKKTGQRGEEREAKFICLT